jgi:N-acetylmuramoyl-L-alanine amidase
VNLNGTEKLLTGRRLCIDPGHPSENGVGASRGALTEVGVAWRVASRLRELLHAAGAEVAMTKTREREFVTNRRRAEIANRFRADLMLRLHCDDARGAAGIATYYPKHEGTAPGGRRGPSAAVRAESGHRAIPFHAALTRSLRGDLADRGLLTDRQTAIGARQGALTGSVYSEVPVILVELCVLSASHDAAFAGTTTGETRLAAGLFAGIVAALPPE